MNYRVSSILQAISAGILLPALLAIAWATVPQFTVDRWREAVTDRLLLGTGSLSGTVTVVDIDAPTLAAAGAWPWPRERLAGLLRSIAGGQPRAIGLDILLAGEDRYGARALARQLGPSAAANVIDPDTLPDGDASLADALLDVPSVLSTLLQDLPGQPFAGAPLLMNGPVPRLAPWSAAGAILPYPLLMEQATGIGIGSLAGEGGGVVRSVPLLAIAGDSVVGGLAAELLKQAEGASAFILDGDRSILSIGDAVLPLGREANLRFRPSPPAAWSQRTIPAGDVLAGKVKSERFRDQIILIGGSAPELGALRPTAAFPLAPSVQIQADALETMLGGQVPFRPGWASKAEGAVFAALVLAGALAGALLSPGIAALLTLPLAVLWSGGTIWLIVRHALLLDPVTPALGGLLALGAAATVIALRQLRLARNIRRRFEQHLSPQVVALIAQRPEALRLEGERREVTAMFTDIEGFSGLADRLGPQALITLLDGYFNGVVEAVVRHGGMVDKIVGDALHAFFNAPIDLADHPAHALAAARDILAFSERYRKTDAAVAAALGRTRIGIETGDVVIGDVGAGSKIDYTAHGRAVNTAARLEPLNKTFGTSICVGPEFRSRLPDRAFRSLGITDVRGCGMLELFTPEEDTGKA